MAKNKIIIMTKIAIPFDGSHYPDQCLELAEQLNRVSPVWLSAVFVPSVDYSEIWSIPGGVAGAVFTQESLDDTVECNGERLRTFCANHSIKLTVHEDRLDFALSLIRKEARFSDLMLLSGSRFFDNIDKRQPNAYLKDILHGAESPVLLLPDTEYLPKNVAVAYDGTPDSVAAFKQFAHLFRDLQEVTVTLVYLEKDREKPVPDKQYAEELVAAHFNRHRVLHLKMDDHRFFSSWLPGLERPWLVAGAYGRSALSQLVHRSFAAGLIREHRIPLFIAHK